MKASELKALLKTMDYDQLHRIHAIVLSELTLRLFTQIAKGSDEI